jgi:hypothetical protein
MIHNGELKDFKNLISDMKLYVETNTSKIILGGFLKVFLSHLIKLIQDSYVIINESKYLLEIQYTKQKLLKNNNLKKGKLLQLSKNTTVIKRTGDTNSVTPPYKVLKANEVVLYLDVVYLQANDCLAIEILKEDSVYFLPPQADYANLIEYFNKVFIVL